MSREHAHIPKSLRPSFCHLPEEKTQCFCDEEWDVIKGLLSASRKSKGDVQIAVEMHKKELPATLTFTVVAPDWSGLINTVAGSVHEKGYNIQCIHGLTTVAEDFGIVQLTVLLESKKMVNQAKTDFEDLANFLRVIGRGGASVKKLIHIGAKKLEVYESILNALKKITKPKEYKELAKEEGEVAMFVTSRSEAYLVERFPEDLAGQILVNYRFQKELRSRRSRVLVHVENIKTTREELTCISAAGYDRDLSLDDLLDEIREFVPDFQRKYDKEFVTRDGIAVMRLEMVDSSGGFIPTEDLSLLERRLEGKLRRKHRRSRFYIKTGTELFGRILIPRLVQEAESTGIPQVYIFPGRMTRESSEFRVSVVSPLKGETLGSVREGLVDSFLRIGGLYVTSTKPPAQLKDIEIDLIGLRADVGEFPSEEKIYEEIKKCVAEVVGEFRDFDEGMRLSDRKKIDQVADFLRTRVDVRLVREYFYEMDDFYRISAPVKAIAEEIMFADTLIKGYFRDGKFHLEVREADGMILVGLIFPSRTVNLELYLKAMNPYNPFLTRLEAFGATLATFNVKKKGSINTSKLKKELKKVK
jgi:acetolactate synthase small subunit